MKCAEFLVPNRRRVQLAHGVSQDSPRERAWLSYAQDTKFSVLGQLSLSALIFHIEGEIQPPEGSSLVLGPSMFRSPPEWEELSAGRRFSQSLFTSLTPDDDWASRDWCNGIDWKDNRSDLSPHQRCRGKSSLIDAGDGTIVGNS